MDTMTIIYIAIAFVVGVVVAYFFTSSKGKEEATDTNTDDNSAAAAIEEAEKKSADYLKQIESYKSEIDSLKKKQQSALNEANSKISELNKQLQGALEGKIDDSLKAQLADVDKLKKKIKNLEDDLEDMEDDLDSAKKKLKSKDEESRSLQDELDKINRSYKLASEELDKTKEELNDKIKELDLKMESLTFVQEILSAGLSKDASVAKLYPRIDALSDFISTELQETVCDIYNLNNEVKDALFGDGLASWEATAKKDWIKGKTSIAFVGEFSAGKTSIVNRILSQDDPKVPLLPVSTKATTAIPTYISGGVGTIYQFFTPDNQLKNLDEKTFKRVNKEVLDQVKGVSSLIQYFVMKYKNPHLGTLSILDTPGFNSNDPEDAERTIGVINECDALFWVFDVNTGTVNRTSINLIKEHLHKPLYVVINKVDTKAKSEVDKVETLIRKTLSEAGLSVKGYIRFSSKAPLADIMTPIKSVGRDSNKDNYLQTLIGALETWTKEQEKDVLKAKKEADRLLSISNNLVDKYNNAIKNLSNDCVTVAGIPHFEEHLFRKDGYEMSIADYNTMTRLLEKICSTRCDDLCNLYNEQMEARGNLEQAWNAHADERIQWQRLNESLNILKKKIKDLDKK